MNNTEQMPEKEQNPNYENEKQLSEPWLAGVGTENPFVSPGTDHAIEATSPILSMPLNILFDVDQEIKSSVEKHGMVGRKPTEMIAILTEEVGEAAREAVKYQFESNHVTVRDYHRLRYRAELVQVVAFGIKMLMLYDQGELGQFKPD